MPMGVPHLPCALRYSFIVVDCSPQTVYGVSARIQRYKVRTLLCQEPFAPNEQAHIWLGYTASSYLVRGVASKNHFCQNRVRFQRFFR